MLWQGQDPMTDLLAAHKDKHVMCIQDTLSLCASTNTKIVFVLCLTLALVAVSAGDLTHSLSQWMPCPLLNHFLFISGILGNCK